MFNVVLNGYFRSGTSMMFRVIQESFPDDTHIYEPLHIFPQRLVELTATRNKKRKAKLQNAYGSWLQHQKDINGLWNSSLERTKLILDGRNRYPELKRYLDFVSAVSPSVCAKFTSMTLRSKWLLSNYPSSKMILLVRDPRDVWNSINRSGPPRGKFNGPHDYKAKLYYSALANAGRVNSVNHRFQQFMLYWLEMFDEFEKLNQKPNTTLVWYEDVARHPKATFDKIFADIGVQLTSNRESISAKSVGKARPYYRGYNALLRDLPKSDRIRWRQRKQQGKLG